MKRVHQMDYWRHVYFYHTQLSHVQFPLQSYYLLRTFSCPFFGQQAFPKTNINKMRAGRRNFIFESIPFLFLNPLN